VTARLFFVLAPAVVIGGTCALIHPVFGAIVGACVVGLGVQCTTARPERGETP